MARKNQLIPSGRHNACPVCSRTKDRDCRTAADGESVICHHAKDLFVGQVVIGAGDGMQWAFTGNTKDGRAGHFVLHKPRKGVTTKAVPFDPPAQQVPSLSPAPTPAPLPPEPPMLSRMVPREAQGSPFIYSDTLRTNRAPLPGGGKRFYCEHLTEGRWADGAGPDLWPVFHHDDVTAAESWVIETEGEKCAEIIAAAGFVAISQPGHAHSVAQIQQRYAELAFEGLMGVVYLADADETGRRRADQAIEAAAAAELPLLVLHAGDLWPGLPDGESIDDAPGTVADAIAIIEAAAIAAHAEAQQQDAERAAEPAPEPPQEQARHAKPKGKPARVERRLGHNKRMRCMLRCIQVQAKRERNTLKRRARLLKVASDLGLSKLINRQEIAQQILEAKDEQQGQRFRAMSAADRLAMERPKVTWLVTGLIPANDLTIIGGRPKVGKTRFSLSVAAALLDGGSVLDFECEGSRPVVLVTDDQGDGDSADMLDALAIWEHQGLIWSPNFRLTEADLDRLSDTVRANPGALVILDSLRSIGRSLQHGENDPEMGAILYDLKAEVIRAGGTLIVIHHCNKGDGLVGTEALSGHSAISGAANTIITMHYMPDGNGRPVKDAPQRRIVREARSGQGFDLVISPQAGTGSFMRSGTFSEWQEMAKGEAEQARAQQRLTHLQRQVLEVLTEEWMTRRDVTEAVGETWEDRGRNPEARRVEDALRRLVDVQMAEAMRAGREFTYRISLG